MSLWKIEACSDEGSEEASDRTIWPRLLVKAPTEIAARLLAARNDSPKNEPKLGNESQWYRSRILDSKSYAVTVADAHAAEEFAQSCPSGAVCACAPDPKIEESQLGDVCINERRFGCSGGGSLGHPKVYYSFDGESAGARLKCAYCSTVYRYEPGTR